MQCLLDSLIYLLAIMGIIFTTITYLEIFHQKNKYCNSYRIYSNLKNKKEIVATFELLGNKYGYPRNQMESDSLSVVELHYSNIYKFRKEVKDIFAIYMIPKNIETAIQKLKERNLSKEVEIKRIEEIKEHIENFKKDKNLREQFDYILYNDYTENTVKEIIEIVKNKTNEFLQKSIQV